MIYLLLICIITKLATTDLHMNIKRNPLLLLSMKLLFYTTSFVKLNLRMKGHEAFLVNKLMHDIQEICKEHGLEEPPAELRHSNRLKEKRLDDFDEKIQFTKIGNKNVLHSSDVSPLTYSEATTKGHGLREDDIANAFANLIRKKLSEKKDFEKTCRFKPPIPSEA